MVLSGVMFPLEGVLSKVGNLTIAKWGITALNAQADINHRPVVTLWNQMVKAKTLEIEGQRPIQDVLIFMEKNGLNKELNLKMAELSANPAYNTTDSNVIKCWVVLLLFSVLFAFLSMVFLKMVDKDKR